MGKKVTIKQLADKIGVSISTVSNTLNDKGKVSAETKNRIIELAKQLGYPFEEKKSGKKSTEKTGRIGLIFPSHSNAYDQNYYISEVLAGVEERVKDEGYSLMIESYNDMMPDLVLQDLDGLMLVGGQFPESFIVKLALSDCPFVSIGTYSVKVPMNAVMADNYMGAYLAATHLLGLGHRRIGLINGPVTTNSSRIKYEGFREALAAFDAKPENEWMTGTDFTIDHGYEVAGKFVRMKNRPTALFIADDPIAIGAIRAFQDAGLSVPGDIAVVGFGNSPTGNYISPALTTIDVYKRKLGIYGANRLLELIRRKRAGEETPECYRLLCTTSLIVRDSCGERLKANQPEEEDSFA